MFKGEDIIRPPIRTTYDKIDWREGFREKENERLKDDVQWLEKENADLRRLILCMLEEIKEVVISRRSMVSVSDSQSVHTEHDVVSGGVRVWLTN